LPAVLFPGYFLIVPFPGILYPSNPDFIKNTDSPLSGILLFTGWKWKSRKSNRSLLVQAFYTTRQGNLKLDSALGN
jgi:hypothetical protein